jgi:hypothetical protein
MREKPTNHQLFIQFIMYGSSYMFWHYIAIFRELVPSERCSIEEQ